MDARQQFALTNPLNRADNFDAIAQLTVDRKLPGKMLVRSILAVDR